MDSHFAAARAASERAAGAQQYPCGALYVVATPIGNLADITLRALHVLSLVDRIACEDTRTTQQLLRCYGIDKPAASLLALHQHNEASAASRVLQELQAGKRVAYVSDAGTPAISDPGARLVAAARAQGVRCIPVPGVSSVTTALSVSGAQGDDGFVFQGFLPTQAKARAAALQGLAQEARAIVLLEAPHRLNALALDLQALGERRITVGRELTKNFEEIVTLSARELSDWLCEDVHRTRGEFVLVVHAHTLADEGAAQSVRVLSVLLAHLPLKTAVQLAAELCGQPRNALYAQALRLQVPGGPADRHLE